MSESQKRFFNVGVFLGVGLIIFGGVALLKNFGLKIDFDVWKLWPVVFVFAGIGVLVNTKTLENFIDGLLLLLLGGVLLVSNFQLIEGFSVRFWKLWPLFILYIGLKILIQSLGSKQRIIDGKADFNISAVFGGGDYRFEARNLKSGKIVAIFGGGSVNLRDAEIEGESMVLQCFAMFGGIDLIVPDHWMVMVNATPILGGIDNQAAVSSRGDQPAKKILYVEGMVVFGGIDIKN